jgi:hypothetical protein
MEAAQQQDGLYCSTAGTYFSSKQDLEDHYRSDFHRCWAVAERWGRTCWRLTLPSLVLGSACESP